MRRNRKTHHALVLSAIFGLASLTSCGAVDKANDAAKTAKAIEKAAGATTADGSVDQAAVDKVIGTMLEQTSGQRGKKVQGPGKIKFFNVLTKDGKPVNVDVWWGRPDEKAKAASIVFGETSEWMPPMITKGFGDSKSASYSVTEQGTTTELWITDRWQPTDKSQQFTIFSIDDGGFSESGFDFDPAAVDYRDKSILPAADAGMVRLSWRPIGDVLDGADDTLRAVRNGSTCLTNGTGIAGPDGNQLDPDESVFQAPVGVELGLSTTWCGSNGSAANLATVKVPATSGRGALFAYLAPDGPKLHIEMAP
jgi:hypothetical protein